MLPVWLPDTVTPDLSRALHYTLLWGLEGVELRTVGSAGERVPRVDERSVTERLRKSEMLAVAVSPGLFEAPLSARAQWMNGLATFGETVRFAERLGCPRIVVGAFAREPDGGGVGAEGKPLAPAEEAVRAYRRAADQAPPGLTLAVLNETGYRCETGAALARLLDAVDRPGVQAAWNPAAALRAGEAPADGLRALGSRVALVRCSDGTFEPDDDGAHWWYDTTFGSGDVGWGEQLRLLHAAGFRGPLSLEVHLEPRPAEGLRAAARLVHMIRDASRAGAASES